MSKLKVREECVRAVDYSDLEDFIAKVYGIRQRVSVCAMEEWRNDSHHRFHVKKEPLSVYEQKEIEEFSESGNGSFITYAIMTDMCNNGHIEPGEYLVGVSW